MATFSISGISNKNLSSILNTDGTITLKPKITSSDTTTKYIAHFMLDPYVFYGLMTTGTLKGTNTITLKSHEQIEDVIYNLGNEINYSSFKLVVWVTDMNFNTYTSKEITITNDMSVPKMSSYSNTRAIDNNMYSFNIVSEFRYGSVFSSSTAKLTSSDGTSYTANGTLQSDGKTIVYLFTSQTWSSHFTDKKYDVVVTVKNTKNQTGTFNVPFPFHYLPNVTNWTMRRLNGIEDIVIFRGTLEMSKYRTDGIAVDRFTLAFNVNGGDNVWHSQPENFDVSLFGEQNAYNRVTCNVEFAVRGDPNIDNKWATDKDYLVAISCSARSSPVVISTAYKIPKGIPTMAFRTDGTVGVAIGQYYDESVGGLLQVNGQINSTHTDIGFSQYREYNSGGTKVDREIRFGIGAGGNNRGIYDVNAGGWVFELDSLNELRFRPSTKPFVFESYSTTSASISADSYQYTTFDISKSGYTAIGVVSFRCSNQRGTVFRCEMSEDGNQVIFGVHNIHTSAIAPTLYIKVLYYKNA